MGERGGYEAAREMGGGLGETGARREWIGWREMRPAGEDKGEKNKGEKVVADRWDPFVRKSRRSRVGPLLEFVQNTSPYRIGGAPT